MAKRLLIAREEDNTPVEPVVEPVSDIDPAAEVAVQQSDAAASDVVADLNEVVEGDEVLDTSNKIADTVEAAVEGGEGLDDSTAEVVAAATEHFYNKLGYSSKRSAVTALENFGTGTTADKLNSSKCALEDLKQFDGRATVALNVAQEGVFSRLGNSIKLMFTSRDKIRQTLESAISGLAEKGAREGIIQEPGWGRSFAKIGKKELAGSDAVTLVNNYAKLCTSSELIGLLGDYTKFINDLIAEVSKSRWIVNDEAVKAIQAMNERADTIGEKADKLIAEDVKTAKNDPSFSPLDVKEGEKLAEAVRKILDNATLQTALQRVSESVSNANSALYSESMLRVVGPRAKDLRAAQQLIRRMNPILIDVFSIVGRMDRLSFACVRYITASTAK